MDKILLTKLKTNSRYISKGINGNTAKIARWFGISRYQLMYWLGWLKRRPRVISGLNSEGLFIGPVSEEYMNEARAAKERFSQSIIAGKTCSENPVQEARELRQIFYRIYQMMPEDVK